MGKTFWNTSEIDVTCTLRLHGDEATVGFRSDSASLSEDADGDVDFRPEISVNIPMIMNAMRASLDERWRG